MPARPAQSTSQPVSITWKRGEFHTFYAQMKIRVGGTGPNQNVDIQDKDDFEYDGTTCKYAGMEFAQPSLRKAIQVGWATMDPEGNTPAPFVASRDIAVSQSKTKDLSRVQRHAHDDRMEADSLDEETVINVSDRQAARNPRTGAGHLTAKDNKRAAHSPGTFRGLDVTQSDIDSQDGRSIGKVRSAATVKVDIIANPGAARDIEAAQDVSNGYGRLQKERGQRVEREGVIITGSRNVDRSRAIEVGDETSGKVVGSVRHSSAKERVEGGVTVKDGNRRPVKAASPAPAPKPVQRIPDDASPKLKLALRICPDFPIDWNFFAKSDDKVKRIKTLGASSDLLDALYSVESAAMKKVMETKFKTHFV